MIQRILVPLDGSTASEAALPVAAAIATAMGAAIHIAHVHTLRDQVALEGVPILDSEGRVRGRDHERIYLERVAGRLRVDHGIIATTANPDGPAIAPTLMEEARRRASQLVVMSSHGRHGLERLLLGSTAIDLIHLGQLPVLIVPPRYQAPVESGPYALRRVLVAIDDRPASHALVERTLALLEPFRPSYTLLSVLKTASAQGRWGLFAPISPATARPEPVTRRDLAQANLDVRAWGLRARSLRVETRVVEAAQPHQVILDIATTMGSDLIVLPAEPPAGLIDSGRSVTDAIIGAAHIPVLVCRAATAAPAQEAEQAATR